MRRHVRLWIALAAAVTLAAAGLASCGGGGGGAGTPPPPPNAPVTLLATDLPPSCVQAFKVSLTIDLVKPDNTTVPLVGTPMDVEFVRLLGFTTVLGKPSITLTAPTTFTAVRFTLSKPMMTVLDGGTFATLTTTPDPTRTTGPDHLTLSPAIVVKEFPSPITVTPGNPLNLLIDFDLARSVKITSTTGQATGVIDPTFSVRQVRNIEKEIELEDVEDLDRLVGTVTSVDTVTVPNSFQLQVAPSTTLTITVNSSTKIELEDDRSGALTDILNTVVEVDAVFQADGPILAREVEVNEVTRIVVGVTPDTGRATSFDSLHRGSVPDLGFTGPIVTVNLPLGVGRNNFKIHTENLNVDGFSFDASHLAVGQRVTIEDIKRAASTNTAEAQERDRFRVTLEKEAVDGKFVRFTANGFVLEVTSSLKCLLPPASNGNLIVKVQRNTRFVRVGDLTGLRLNDPVRVTGLVFRNPNVAATARDIVMLAKKVKKLTAGPGT